MFAPRYKYVVLGALLLISISGQWQRWLLDYLSAVPAKDCTDVCYETNSRFQGFCQECQTSANRSGWVEACCACLTKAKYPEKNVLAGACITPAEYGILMGFAFAALYSIVGLFGGRASDVLNRKWLIAAAALFWSLATILSGVANSFTAMLLCRMALGIGQAFLTPAAYSILADYFALPDLVAINGIYNIGIYVGSALSSLSILLAQQYGWRATAYGVGAVGMTLALAFAAFVREPQRGLENRSPMTPSTVASEESEDSSVWEAVRIILKNRRLQLLYFGTAFRFMGGFVIADFMPQYYMRSFGEHEQAYSLLNAVVVGVGGVLSSVLGGFFAETWSRKTRRGLAYVPSFGTFLAIPCFALTLFATNFNLSMVCLFLEYFFAECWIGPAMVIIQMELTPRVRGTGVALFMFIGTMFGSAGPAILGFLDASSAVDLKYLMLALIVITYGMSAKAFMLLGNSLPAASVNIVRAGGATFHSLESSPPDAPALEHAAADQHSED